MEFEISRIDIKPALAILQYPFSLSFHIITFPNEAFLLQTTAAKLSWPRVTQTLFRHLASPVITNTKQEHDMTHRQ